jgi:hypothetical protein
VSGACCAKADWASSDPKLIAKTAVAALTPERICERNRRPAIVNSELVRKTAPNLIGPAAPDASVSWCTHDSMRTRIVVST